MSCDCCLRRFFANILKTTIMKRLRQGLGTSHPRRSQEGSYCCCLCFDLFTYVCDYNEEVGGGRVFF